MRSSRNTLLDIEPRLRRVSGYQHMPTLRVALKRELKIDTTCRSMSFPRPRIGAQRCPACACPRQRETTRAPTAA